MENAKKRYSNIDIIKAIGMFWVLSLHVDVWRIDFLLDNNVSMYIQYAFRLIAEGVPIFMLLNGYLTFNKSSFFMEKHIKKMGKVFVLILIWGVILTVVQSIGNNKVTPGLMVKSLLNTWVGAPYTGVLWFLQGLLAVYLLYPVLKYVYDNNKSLYVYLFAIVAFFSIGLHLIDLLMQMVSFIRPSEVPSLVIPFLRRFEPFNFDQIVSYIFYAMLGGMIAYREEDLRKRRTVLAVSGIAAWMVSFGIAVFLSIRYGYIYNPASNFCSVFMTILLIGLFVFMKKDKDYHRFYYKFLESLGKNSFGIYLSHFIFIHTLNKLLPGGVSSYPMLWQRLIMLAVVYLLSWCFSLVMGRIPYLKKLVTI